MEIQHIILEVTITWGIIKDGAIASLSTYYKNAMVLPVISLKADVIVADNWYSQRLLRCFMIYF